MALENTYENFHSLLFLRTIKIFFLKKRNLQAQDLNLTVFIITLRI